MMKKIFSIAFFLSAILVLFLSHMGGLALPIIGGVIFQGVLGPFSGKVGPVVGASWKGIAYMKGYVIPANPNTSAQQTQRSKMAQAVVNAREVLSTLLADYWNPFAVKMSGFNAFVSELLLTFTGANLFAINTKVATGTLTPILSLAGIYTTGTGVLNCSWVDNLVGDALGTDTVVLVVYDKIAKSIIGYQDSGTLRSAEAGTITVTSGLTASNVYIYAFCVQGTGSAMKVSDSLGDVCA